MKKRFFAVAGLIVLISSIVIFAASCGGGGGGDPAVNAIVSVDPANGATGVPVTRAISVVFNANIDETTLIPANVYLRWANGVVNVPGATTYDAGTKTMTFTPNFPMAGGALYTFTITTAVHTKAAAATDYNTTFTTAPAPIIYLTNYNAADPATPLTSYNIWRMNSDGTSQMQLTTYTAGTSVGADAPVWSPDYTKIAYEVAAAWDITKPVNLYSMNADGSSPTALTSGTGNYATIYPVWLRNGSAILFMVTPDSTASPMIIDIASVGPTGSGFTNFTNSTATNSVFFEFPLDLSPLNTSFIYSAGDMATPVENLNIMNVDGTGHATLTNIAANSVAIGLFSPDGTKIYYAMLSPTEAGGIYSINTDGSGVQTLATIPVGNIVLPLGVSPDGTRLAYLFSNLAASLNDIYILNIATVTTVNVTTASGSNEAVPQVKWSPDGSRLAYIFGDDTTGPLDLYVVNADGTSPRNLTGYPAGSYVEGLNDALFPGQWSPDGNQIIFTNYVGLIYNIAVANADGSGITPITNSTTTDSYFGDWW